MSLKIKISKQSIVCVQWLLYMYSSRINVRHLSPGRQNGAFSASNLTKTLRRTHTSPLTTLLLNRDERSRELLAELPLESLGMRTMRTQTWR